MGFDLPSVPVVDLSQPDDAAAEQLRVAATQVGFLYVKDHGVREEVLTGMFNASKAFFALPMEQKESIVVNKWNRGYTKLDDEYLDPERQTEPDTKEGMYIGREVDPEEYGKRPLYGPNQYPDEALVPGFKQAMLAYYAACLACTHRIVRLLALSLGLPADFFREHFTQPIASLRPLHYTAAVSAPDEGRFGAGQHTDYGMITILATDDVPGLQVEVDGEWVSIPPEPGHLIVNLGDLLHRWTNGSYRSAMHRVVTTSGRERYSAAFFVEPNFDSLVEPLPQCCSPGNPARWPPVTSGAYLLSRYNATQPTWAEREKLQAAEAQQQPSSAPAVRAF